MSHYKSAARSHKQADPFESFKYRAQAHQLSEILPSLSNDDIQSLLTEVGGELEVAINRVSEGTFESWDTVGKKDKKAPTSAHASKDSFSSRGDSRGARGGRGGRGGPGRGGAAGRGGRGGSTRGGTPANGRSSHIGTPKPDGTPAAVTPEVNDQALPPDSAADATQQNGAPHTGALDSSAPKPTAPAPVASEKEVNGHGNGVPPAKAPVKPAAPAVKTWAQIAKPKPTPPPQPVPVARPPPPQQQLPAPTEQQTAPVTTPSVPPSIPAPEPVSEPEEPATTTEPTTVQQEEPPKPEEPEAKPEEPEPEPEKVEPAEKPAEAPAPAAAPLKPEPEPATIPASKSEPAPLAATPSIPQIAVAATPSPKLAGRPASVAHRNSARYKNIDGPVVMPTSSSFATGIEKVGMQFGSLSIGGDILDAPEPEAPAPAPEAEPAPAAPAAPEPITPAEPAAPAPTKPQEAPAPAPPPATAPAATSISGSTLFSQQQSQPPLPAQTSQPAAPQPIQTQQQQQQPAQPTPTAAHTAATASPIQQLAQQQHQQQAQQAQQHSLTSTHQQPPHLQQHLSGHPQQQQQQQQAAQQHTPSQSHNQYAQHGLPTHIEPSPQSATQQQQGQQQHQGAGASHSANYFGRELSSAAAPYFHTPTPPAGGQNQDYGAFGGLSGQGLQGNHLGAFGNDYGYSENQRGFYDSYQQQQSAFNNRNILGQDDLKALPGSQHQPQSAGLGPAGGQSSQPHSAIQGGQGQPGNQGPQQYSVPYPYYTYPQQVNYYGTPYGVAPQFKYPAMFQPPPGPQSAPSPVTKQPGAGVAGALQGNNPYSQGLYPQSGYDDYSSPHHHSQHSQHNSHALGLGQGGVGGNDYGKQLYGGGQAGGIQGFMGLGGQGGAAAGGPQSNTGGPRGSGSPDTPYKPYAPKDVGGVAAGRGTQQPGQGQGQPQGQGQGGQGPQGQGFYGGGARFGGGVGAGGLGGPQQNVHHPQGGPQSHLYGPQGGNDGFYQQYRGQQQYWQ